MLNLRRLEAGIYAGASACIMVACIYFFSESVRWLTPLRSWFRLDYTSFTWLIIPVLVGISLITIVKELAPIPTFTSRFVVAIAMAILGCRYFAWRILISLNLDSFWNGLASITLTISEAIFLINSIGFFFLSIFRIDRHHEADLYSELIKNKSYSPSVDIIVPTYNESADILRRTVLGCQALDYSNKHIYILDDKRRPEIRLLAQELGCGYRDRPTNEHAKAGNINYALPSLQSELIVVFDADFIPTRNFLTRTVGFFSDPKLGLLQTPQSFFNEDPVSVNLGVSTIVPNEQLLFFRHIQPSRDYFESVICCGTCFVVRREALDCVGGIPTDSLCEDYALSVRLQFIGYSVKYLNEALSAGLSPETISAFISQRLRWGTGTLQLFLSGKINLGSQGLRFFQKFSHSLSFIYWISSIPRLLFLIFPLLFLYFNVAPFKSSLSEILYFFLPYYFLTLMSFSWLTGGRRSIFWSDIYETIICVPMSLTVIGTLIKPTGGRFKVTPKGDIDTRRIRPNWILIHPLLLILLASLGGLIWRVSGWSDLPTTPQALIISGFWVGYNCVLLVVSCLTAIDVPQRAFTRFECNEPCELVYADQVLSGHAVNLSEQGGLIQSNDIPQARADRTGYLRFDDQSKLAGLCLQVYGRRQVDNQLGVEFSPLSLMQQRQLIPFLYCRPGQWDEVRSPETHTALALFRSVLRLYPLADSR